MSLRSKERAPAGSRALSQQPARSSLACGAAGGLCPLSRSGESSSVRPCGTHLGTQMGARWADHDWSPVVLLQSPFSRAALPSQSLDYSVT